MGFVIAIDASDESGLCVDMIVAEAVTNESMTYTKAAITKAIVEHYAHTTIGDGTESKPWIINSGCSTHFSPNWPEFIKYTPYVSPQQICLGDSRVVPSIGEGTVLLTCLVGGKSLTHLIHSVQYVPTLTYALLSCRALTSHGLTIIFKGSSCRIYHNDNTLIAKSAETRRHLYFLNMTKMSRDVSLSSNAALTTMPSFNLTHK